MRCPEIVTEHPTRGVRFVRDEVAGLVCPHCRQAYDCMLYDHDWQPAAHLGNEPACTRCHLVKALTPCR